MGGPRASLLAPRRCRPDILRNSWGGQVWGCVALEGSVLELGPLGKEQGPPTAWGWGRAWDRRASPLAALDLGVLESSSHTPPPVLSGL